MNKITFEVRNGVTYCLLNGVVIGQANKAELGMTEEEVLELIEGNPDMTPTEVLEKIKIGDTVFSVVGGEEVDTKIDASHLYIIDDTDFLPNNQISERFKHIINVHATFKYNGTNGDAIAVNNSSAIGLTFIPVADEHVSEGFPKLYQTIFISVDSGRPEVDIIAFTLNNNEFSSSVVSHFTYPYNQIVAPQLLGDTDNYVIFNDMLMIPSIATQLQNAAGQDMISGMKIFNIQLLDNNNLINTLPEETKIVFGDINVQESFMVIDVKSSVSLTMEDLTAPVMTVGSIKRFRVSDTDPVLKDSYVFSAYPMIGQNALVVLTERDTNGGGGTGASNCMYELRSNNLKFYDVNGDEISTELTKFAFRFSDAGFEELKEKVNPLLLEIGASPLTDFNSLVAFLNDTTQETVASTSNLSVIILTLLASYTLGNYWLDSMMNPATQQMIPNAIYSNIFFMYLGIQVVTASGAQNTLIQLVDNSTGNMVGINATWEFSQYGSSGGGSGAYYEIKTNDIAFYDEGGTPITSNVLTNLKITMSEAQFEAFKEFVNPGIQEQGLPILTDINSLISLMNQVSTSEQTDSSLIATAILSMTSFANYYAFEGETSIYTEFVSALVGLKSLSTQNYYGLMGIDEPIKLVATWTLSQYGTSGGSSASESYYKIQLQDSGEVDNEPYATILKLIVDKQDFNDLLTALNQLMGSNLSTPQDVINAYDNTKGDSNYFSGWALAFVGLASASLDRNYNALIWRADTFTREKIVKVGDATGIYCGEIGGTLLKQTPTLKGQISFSSSSTLAITEQTNQKI